jgi:hypothetical protein
VTDRVLLIGERAAVLTRLQAALRELGITADLTQDTTDADQSELREYRAMAFGRAVPEPDRARMKEAFRAANPTVAFVDGLAPITPLLLAQFEQALDRRPEHERALGEVTAADGRIKLDLRSQARVRVTVYRLTRLHRTHIEQLLDQRLTPGIHTVDLRPRAAGRPRPHTPAGCGRVPKELEATGRTQPPVAAHAASAHQQRPVSPPLQLADPATKLTVAGHAER